MIKKLIGIVIAAAVIAVIIVVVLHRDKYTSLVFDEPEAEAVFQATAEKDEVLDRSFEPTAADTSAQGSRVPQDTLATDSLAVRQGTDTRRDGAE